MVGEVGQGGKKKKVTAGGPEAMPQALSFDQQREQERLRHDAIMQQQAAMLRHGKPQTQQVLFDINLVERLAQVCKHYNLTQIQVGNIIVVNTRPEIGPIVPGEKPVTDEEILHNPYARM